MELPSRSRFFPSRRQPFLASLLAVSVAALIATLPSPASAQSAPGAPTPRQIEDAEAGNALIQGGIGTLFGAAPPLITAGALIGAFDGSEAAVEGTWMYWLPGLVALGAGVTMIAMGSARLGRADSLHSDDAPRPTARVVVGPGSAMVIGTF